jgi:hypothetical protein
MRRQAPTSLREAGSGVMSFSTYCWLVAFCFLAALIVVHGVVA